MAQLINTVVFDDNNMIYTLRKVISPDDFPFLRELHMATMFDYIQEQLGMNEAQQEKRTQQDLDEVSQHFQIIMVNGEAAGMVWVEDKEQEVYLAIIQIAPKFQKKGLGAQIMRDLVIGPAKAKGIPAVLHVFKVNKDAQKFYQSLNFKVVEEETNRFKMVLAS